MQKVDINFFEKIFDGLISNLQVKTFESLPKFLISDEILPPYQLSKISTFNDIILIFILIEQILNI